MQHWCPKCSVVLEEIRESDTLRFRCSCCNKAYEIATDDLGQITREEVGPEPPSVLDASPEPSMPRWRHALRYAVLTLVVTVLGGWFFVLFGIWAIIYFGLAIGVIYQLIRLVIQSDFPAISKGKRLRLAFCWGGLGCILFLLRLYFGGGTVYIDNFSRQDLSVEVDGDLWITSRTGSNLERPLHWGHHEILVRDAKGKQVDRFNVEIARDSKYILNLLGAQTYYKGYVQYSWFAIQEAPEEIREHWIAADVDYLFVQPPDSITVEVSGKGPAYTSARKSYILRGQKPSFLEDSKARQ